MTHIAQASPSSGKENHMLEKTPSLLLQGLTEEASPFLAFNAAWVFALLRSEGSGPGESCVLPAPLQTH